MRLLAFPMADGPAQALPCPSEFVDQTTSSINEVFGAVTVAGG